MPITSGRTKTIAILMDLQAVILQIKSSFFSELLKRVDDAIAVDMSDDSFWHGAKCHLENALTLDDPTNKDSEINKALRLLTAGLKIDLSDTSKEAIRQSILPYEESIARIGTRTAALQRELSKGDGGRS